MYVVKDKAASGERAGRRDYALLLFYVMMGIRLAEIIGSHGREVVPRDDSMVIRDRASILSKAGPLWTRHDRAGGPSRGFVHTLFAGNLKAYAEAAGLKNARIHRTRHTFGRLVAEQTGSLVEKQDALDHANLSTTRVYVERIVVKRDRFSKGIAERFGGKMTPS